MRVSESQRLARGSARQAPGDAHCLLLLQSRTKLGWGRGRQEAGGTGKGEGHPRLSVLRPRPRPQAWGSRAGPRPPPPEANLPDRPSLGASATRGSFVPWPGMVWQPPGQGSASGNENALPLSVATAQSQDLPGTCHPRDLAAFCLSRPELRDCNIQGAGTGRGDGGWWGGVRED